MTIFSSGKRPRTTPPQPIHVGRRGRGSVQSAALWLALGAALAGGWQAYSASRKRALALRTPTIPQALQTWESEGGSPLPAGD